MNQPPVIYEVQARPSRSGALILVFTLPCYMCGRRHQHGSQSGRLDADGTYGRRVEHCSTPKKGYPGRHLSGYVLVPEGA